MAIYCTKNFRGGQMVLLALAAVVLCTATAHAQNKNNKNQPKKEKFVGSGVIEAVSPIMIKANIGGQPWLIKAAEKATLTVTGTAEPDFLKSGLWVRVQGEFDVKTKKALAPLAEIELVTPSATMPPGIAGASVGAPTAGGAPAAGGLQPVFGDDPPKPAATPAGPPAATQSWTVVGQIKSIKPGGEVTINAGNGSVRVDLSPDISVKVNASDFSYVRQGDTIDIKKGYYFAQQMGGAFGEEMSVSLITPLSNPKKRLPVKPDEKPDAATPATPPALPPFGVPPEENK